jgi:hypothetical protein
MYLRFTSLFFLITIGVLLTPAVAKACPMDAPQVREADILRPPANMLAMKGQIMKILPLGTLKVSPPSVNFPLGYITKPHPGFLVYLKILSTTQGKVSTGSTMIINYGGCHDYPGKVGDVIYALALQDKQGGWYAPQFW